MRIPFMRIPFIKKIVFLTVFIIFLFLSVSCSVDSINNPTDIDTSITVADPLLQEKTHSFFLASIPVEMLDKIENLEIETTLELLYVRVSLNSNDGKYFSDICKKFVELSDMKKDGFENGYYLFIKEIKSENESITWSGRNGAPGLFTNTLNGKTEVLPDTAFDAIVIS